MQATRQVAGRSAATARAVPSSPPGNRERAAIEDVTPQVDGGRFAAKAIAGRPVVVEADVFTDGHAPVTAALLHRAATGSASASRNGAAGGPDGGSAGGSAGGASAWQEVPMEPIGNDRFRAAFVPATVGLHEYCVEAWVDEHGGRAAAAQSRVLPVWADPERARASAWYELFPRSTSPTPGRHGTLPDVEARLPYLAGMGFDVLYLPPIHPIGQTSRKGPNNALKAGPADPGSPWAIGGREGGHKAIHPELGTLEDFGRLVRAAKAQGIDIALDYALQCSPDHPYIREHPQWFRWRDDGTVAYAENPPKKYEDVVPFNFDTPDREALWNELASILDHWIEHGVRIFRVDNPHTKPFAFWEWLIARTKSRHPDVLFLSEAFTRPKVMRRLGKIGFSHSYTYFAWRNTKWELEQYVEELRSPAWRDALRPHFWPNTPDILTSTLQEGGLAAAALRFTLAATLSANYGVYGPVLELGASQPHEPGKEEYLDSEKYEVRHWPLDQPGGLAPYFAKVNALRRSEAALTEDRHVKFHGTDNPHLLVYSKRTEDRNSVVLVIVNLDWRSPQSGWTELDMQEIGLPWEGTFPVTDLLDGSRFDWNGRRNFVRLDPARQVAHILRIPTRKPPPDPDSLAPDSPAAHSPTPESPRLHAPAPDSPAPSIPVEERGS